MVGLLLVASLIVGWWLGGEEEPPPGEPAVASWVPPPPPPVAVAMDTPTPVVPPPAQPVPRGDDEVEVCGVGWVSAAAVASGHQTEAMLVAAAGVDVARRRILDSMASSSDAFDRAVALWLRPDEDNVFVDRREQLAREATGTSDGRVYGLAYRTCRQGPRGEGTCALLSPEQWARLDPENALPWLYALEAADKRQDPAAADEALYRISVSSRFGEGNTDPAAAVLKHAVDDDASLLASYVLVSNAIGTSAAWSDPSPSMLKRCGRDQVADANRHQVCASVASLMRERSGTIMSRFTGRRLGIQLGESPESIAREGGELNKMLHAVSDAFVSLSCADIRRTFGQFTRIAAVGEVEAIREREAGRSLAAAIPPR
jgi:hypothetical protein